MRYVLSSAGSHLTYYTKSDMQKCDFYLESFWKLPSKKALDIMKSSKMFLLDSGGYTFINSGKGASLDVDSYLQAYVDFINDNDIKYFFDIDIEEFIGYDKVLKNRKKIEKLTNKQPIPVWHKPLGCQAFFDMCDEYKYVAISGFAHRHFTEKHFPAISKMIDIAHSKGCKVHGLGVGRMDLVYRFSFDSTDSTTWLLPSYTGIPIFFDKGTGRLVRTDSTFKYARRKAIGSAKDLSRHNFLEAVKFQQYAKKNIDVIKEEDM